MVMVEGEEKLKTLAQVEIDPMQRLEENSIALGEGVQVNLGLLKKNYEIIKLIYINPDKWMSEAISVTLNPVSIKTIAQKRKPAYRDAVKRYFRGKCRPVSLHMLVVLEVEYQSKCEFKKVYFEVTSIEPKGLTRALVYDGTKINI